MSCKILMVVDFLIGLLHTMTRGDGITNLKFVQKKLMDLYIEIMHMSTIGVLSHRDI